MNLIACDIPVLRVRLVVAMFVVLGVRSLADDGERHSPPVRLAPHEALHALRTLERRRDLERPKHKISQQTYMMIHLL